MAQPFIAVCLPSRGVGHYRTIAGVIREIEPYPHRWCWAIGEPIPNAHNLVTAEALSDARVTHLLYIEDDHLFGVGVLDALLKLDAPVAAADYLLRGGDLHCTLYHERTGTVELVGLGCTLVKRDVFDAIPSPPFQVQSRQLWTGTGWRDTGVPEHAGGQDIFFCQQVRAAGFEIAVLGPEWQVGHLETVTAGGHVNYGADTVRCWGGSPAMPHYPTRKGKTMATEYWKSPSSDLVLDLDPDTPEGAAEITFRRNNGFVQVNKSEAAAAEKANAEAEAARLAANMPAVDQSKAKK